MSRFCVMTLLAAVAAASAVSATAQVPSNKRITQQASLFFGYSYLVQDYRHTQENPVSGGMNGWEAAVTAPRLFSSHLGLAVDFSGHYAGGGFFTPQIYSISAGPQYSVPMGKSTVYVHGLFGGLFASSDVIAQTSSPAVFLFTAGGGLDHPIGSRLDWRVNADYLHGGFSTNDYNQISQIVKNNVSISTGPVFHF